MIWNPALKNVLTYLGSADLQSAAKENAFPFVVLGDYKSPGFNRSNLFLRRISNPPGRPYHLHRITIPPFHHTFPYQPVICGKNTFVFQFIIGTRLFYFESAGYSFLCSCILQPICEVIS